MVCVKAKGSLFGAFHACKVEYLVAEKKMNKNNVSCISQVSTENWSSAEI